MSNPNGVPAGYGTQYPQCQGYPSQQADLSQQRYPAQQGQHGYPTPPPPYPGSPNNSQNYGYNQTEPQGLRLETIQILYNIRSMAENILYPQQQVKRPSTEESSKSPGWFSNINFTYNEAQPNAWASFFNIFRSSKSTQEVHHHYHKSSNNEESVRLKKNKEKDSDEEKKEEGNLLVNIIVAAVGLCFLAGGAYFLGKNEGEQQTLDYEDLQIVCYNKIFIEREPLYKEDLFKIVDHATEIFRLQKATLLQFRITFISFIAGGVFLLLGATGLSKFAITNTNAIKSGAVLLVGGVGYGLYNYGKSEAVDKVIRDKALAMKDGIDQLLPRQYF